VGMTSHAVPQRKRCLSPRQLGALGCEEPQSAEKS
jgi:hypothetical protein